MKSRYWALIWEQLRICGPPCLTFFLGALLSVVFDYLDQDTAPQGRPVYPQENLVIFMQIGAGALIILGRRNREKGGFNLESRLLRLPVSTFVLVATSFGTRVFCMLMTGVAMVVLVALFSGVSLGAGCVILPLLFYMCLQAWAWTVGPLRGIVYVGVFALLSALFFAPMISYPLYDYLSERIATSVLSPIIVGLAAFLLSYLGIHCQRRNLESGIPTIAEVHSWLVSAFAPSARRFSSHLEAQLWYERRRTGRQLFLLLPVFVVVFAWGSMFLEIDSLGWIIPYLALIASAASVGYLVLDTGNFVFTRPVGIRTLARAKYLAMAHSLLFALPIIALLVFTWLFDDAYERFLLTESLRKGIIDPLYVIAMVARPVLIAGCLAWVAAWASTSLMARTLVLLFFGAFVLIKYGAIIPFSAKRLFFCVLLIYAWCLPCMGLGWLLTILSRKVILFALFLWSVMLVTASVVALSVPPGSGNTLYFLGLVPLLFLPFLAVPIRIQKQRVT